MSAQRIRLLTSPRPNSFPQSSPNRAWPVLLMRPRWRSSRTRRLAPETLRFTVEHSTKTGHLRDDFGVCLWARRHGARRSVMPKCNSLLSAFLTAFLTATLIAICAEPARAGDIGYSYARIVRLSYVSGDVQIVRTDKSNKWEPAVMNMPIQQGFVLGTNNGRAEIELESGSTIWLAENSVLQFTELALSNGGRITRMSLSEGTATFDASLSTGDAFEVAAPSFRVTPANKSEFRVDMQGKRG